MEHGDIVDQLTHMLAGMTPDVLEHVLDALSDSDIDFSSLSCETLIEIVSAAAFTTVGAASKQYLERNRGEVRAAILKALTDS